MRTILVVDDDSAVLDVAGRALEGYRVWLACDPDEGMQIAASLPTLELLVTDFMTPSMTGDELIGWLRAERPSLKVLILTGHCVCSIEKTQRGGSRRLIFPNPSNSPACARWSRFDPAACCRFMTIAKCPHFAFHFGRESSAAHCAYNSSRSRSTLCSLSSVAAMASAGCL